MDLYRNLFLYEVDDCYQIIKMIVQSVIANFYKFIIEFFDFFFFKSELINLFVCCRCTQSWDDLRVNPSSDLDLILKHCLLYTNLQVRRHIQ